MKVLVGREQDFCGAGNGDLLSVVSYFLFHRVVAEALQTNAAISSQPSRAINDLSKTLFVLCKFRRKWEFDYDNSGG